MDTSKEFTTSPFLHPYAPAFLQGTTAIMEPGFPRTQELLAIPVRGLAVNACPQTVAKGLPTLFGFIFFFKIQYRKLHLPTVSTAPLIPRCPLQNQIGFLSPVTSCKEYSGFPLRLYKQIAAPHHFTTMRPIGPVRLFLPKRRYAYAWVLDCVHHGVMGNYRLFQFSS